MSGIYSSLLGTPGLRAGIATIAIDGEVLDLVTDGSYDATDVDRETLTGQSGVQGFSEKPKAGFISGQFRDAGNLTVSAIKAKTSSTVVLVCANGKTVTGDGMWCTECSEVNTVEGTFTVRFDGAVVTESSL